MIKGDHSELFFAMNHMHYVTEAPIRPIYYFHSKYEEIDAYPGKKICLRSWSGSIAHHLHKVTFKRGETLGESSARPWKASSGDITSSASWN